MKPICLAPLLTWFLTLTAVAPAVAQAQDDGPCSDPTACNYSPLASPDELADCDYCSCPEVLVPTSYQFESDMAGYGLRVDLVADHDLDNPDLTSLAGMKTYRFYATVSSAEERVSAVFGSNEYGELVMNAPGGFYHAPLGSLIGSGIQSQLFDVGFPALEYDSWVTIGADADPNLLGPGYSAITTIAAEDENWIVLFEPGLGAPGSGFSITSFVGGGWFTLPDSDNCIPDADNAVLIGQFTTAGDLDGVITFQALLDPAIAGFPQDIRPSVAFNTAGLGDPTWSQPEDCPCEADADADADGICEPFDACADLTACNYADPFNADCLYLDACGVCGGDGFPEGTCDCEGTPPDALGICGGSCTEDLDEDGVCDVIDPCVGELDDCGVCNGPGAVYECGCNDIPECDCDCDGNQLDALGECGGACEADLDGDGVCDDVDSCIGELDACGVCNGPGEIDDCGCAGIPAGDCDCDGNQLDALGVCGGDCEADVDGDGVCDVDEVPGCTNPFACNYETEATDDDGSCLTEDALGVCGGTCSADADGNGVCDDEEDCIGELDACGICNGPGAIYDCGCSGIPAGDCDCDGNQLDALGVCGGTCEADLDGDGVCDDVDPCIGELDACGLCNGPGAVFECGCSTTPVGDCDCDGNQLDALGVCGGTCTADADGDGVCDDADDCVGSLDACGVCNGPGEIYDCGCSGIPAGDCDCDGNQLDALGICGGTCTADADGDGVCDDADDCVGSLDACGVCNGPGEIYDCGCSGIPAGDCDCDGNQLDALGVCGGDCAADLDGDGVCDTDELPGCTNPFACNYDATATDDDGTCLTADAIGICGGICTADADGDGVCDDVDPCVGSLDACGVCNGPGETYDCGCSGIPTGDCDCNGNQLDALGICGGTCAADVDGDGICDEFDPCVGSLDACGVCNGPGEIFDCGCSGIPAGDCDCDGNQLDALGVCGGTCTADADGDGVCDDADDCVGSLDACGVCNGPGEIFDCGCAGIPAGDCNCNGNQLDALGVCGGNCESDLDGDGVCDVDELPGCTNPFACNYDAAATDDDGTCLVEDAIGDCGGDCAADADGDGICDDTDPCVGALDACGVCNGPGEIYDCGCSGIPAGDCDCDGSQPDALGLCGGDCAADVDGDGVCDVDEVLGCVDPSACNFDPDATEQSGACFYEDAIGVCGGSCPGDEDGDGICDTEDTCFGDLDACGVCNGPGAIYTCGCDEILPGACDCDGNMPDAVGVCDGECEADDNGNGICDDLEESLCGLGTTWNPDTGQCEGTGGGGDCPADLNGDGVIAVADLLMFLTQLGNQCPE